MDTFMKYLIGNQIVVRAFIKEKYGEDIKSKEKITTSSIKNFVVKRMKENAGLEKKLERYSACDLLLCQIQTVLFLTFFYFSYFLFKRSYFAKIIFFL